MGNQPVLTLQATTALTIKNLELCLEQRVGQDGGVVVDGVDGETDGAQRLRELDVRQEGEPEGGDRGSRVLTIASRVAQVSNFSSNHHWGSVPQVIVLLNA